MQRKPPRESLLVVARNSQVKNKISTFDRQHQHQHGGSSGAPAFSRPAAPPPGRPAGGAGLRPAAGPPLPRRTAAAPALGAIAEEAASLAAGRAPPRRHAAVVSTVTGAPARRHVALVGTNTPAPPPPVALPSPGTKQQVAEKQHQARFPSIMFHPPQPAAPARAPLPGGVAVLPPGPAPAAVQQQQQAWQDEVTPQPRPLPAVLAPVLRSSLSPPQRQPQWQHEEEAAVPAPAVNAPLAAAAAVPAGTDSEEEHFVDADSGGAPSNEGSGGGQALLQPAGRQRCLPVYCTLWVMGCAAQHGMTAPCLPTASSGSCTGHSCAEHCPVAPPPAALQCGPMPARRRCPTLPPSATW